MQAPITVFTQGAKRESGKKAQFGNIMAAKVRSETGKQRKRLGEQGAPRSSDHEVETDRIPCSSHASFF